ncbi:MAG: hypothetical protein SGCHY_003059 [Lobulomycetales sp.]
MAILSFELSGRHVLVAGAEHNCAERIRKLISENAKVTLVAPHDEMDASAAKLIKNKHICYIDRNFEESDLTGADSTFEYSDFQFTAEFSDGALSFGVSSKGHASRLSGRIRNSLQEALPLHAVHAMENVSRVRRRLQKSDPDVEANSPRMKAFDDICQTASLQALASLTESQAVEMIGEKSSQQQFTGFNLERMKALNPLNIFVFAINSVFKFVSSFAVSSLEDTNSLPRSIISASCPEIMGIPAIPESGSSPSLGSDVTLSEQPLPSQGIYTRLSALSESITGIALPETFSSSDIAGLLVQAKSVDIMATGDSILPKSVNTLLHSLLNGNFPTSFKPTVGTLYIAGAGPGNPNLLTGQTLAALQSCDAVFTDPLISPAMLKVLGDTMASTKIYSQKSRLESVESVHARILSLLTRGLTVVKLTSGDPFIYSFTETAVSKSWREHRIIVLPGISSAFGTGLSLMKKHVSDSIFLVSGGSESSLRSLQQFSARTTTIVMAPVANLCRVVEKLKKNGYPDGLPAVIVEKASWGEVNGERMIRARLGNILQEAIDKKVESPAILYTGWALEEKMR